MKNLKNYESDFIISDYKIHNLSEFHPFELCYLPEQSQVILETKQSDYDKYNLIADFFTEEHRIKSKRNNQQSVYSFWEENKSEVFTRCAKDFQSVFSQENLRETLYKITYEVTSFRPTNIVTMIKKFEAKKVLDFCAGWGDRLVGAMACDVEYVGVDPNTKLHESYEQIIEFFWGNFIEN